MGDAVQIAWLQLLSTHSNNGTALRTGRNTAFRLHSSLPLRGRFVGWVEVETSGHCLRQPHKYRTATVRVRKLLDIVRLRTSAFWRDPKAKKAGFPVKARQTFLVHLLRIKLPTSNIPVTELVHIKLVHTSIGPYGLDEVPRRFQCCNHAPTSNRGRLHPNSFQVVL